MKPFISSVEPIIWRDNHLQLMDQRKLPGEVTYVSCHYCDEVIEAIKTMVVRGAPAIGITAAYAVVLANRQCVASHGEDWRKPFLVQLAQLREARPTAVNLDWAVDRMQSELANLGEVSDPAAIEASLLDKAQRMKLEDIAINKAMGDLGAALLGSGSRIITHCNAGALATAGYGTALGVVRSAFRDQRLSQVFACETRPWLQGARLTAWELAEDNIPVTLIADHAAAQLMSRSAAADKAIDWVITGADRVAANGDVANKIGTYALALAARAHGVGMMVVAPTSTIDVTTSSGQDIPIEDRDGEELLSIKGIRIAPPNVPALNPVFDITPAPLIDALVTEKGMIRAPNEAQIKALF